MAIDTAQNRMSAVNPGCPWRGPMVDATVSGFTAANRAAAAYLYAGIEAGEASSPAIHGFKGGRKPYRKTVTYADGRMLIARDEKEYRRFVAELLDHMSRQTEPAVAAAASSPVAPAVEALAVPGLLGTAGLAALEEAVLLETIDLEILAGILARLIAAEEEAIIMIFAMAA